MRNLSRQRTYIIYIIIWGLILHSFDRCVLHKAIKLYLEGAKVKRTCSANGTSQSRSDAEKQHKTASGHSQNLSCVQTLLILRCRWQRRSRLWTSAKVRANIYLMCIWLCILYLSLSTSFTRLSLPTSPTYTSLLPSIPRRTIRRSRRARRRLPTTNSRASTITHPRRRPRARYHRRNRGPSRVARGKVGSLGARACAGRIVRDRRRLGAERGAGCHDRPGVRGAGNCCCGDRISMKAMLAR